MSALLDSSVLIAALVPSEAGHVESKQWLNTPGCAVYVHALNETFAVLTGGSLGFRVDADVAAGLLRERIAERMAVIVLDAGETTTALASARKHGVRGGAVYDYMHLMAARKAGAQKIVTLNVGDFEHLVREGDPAIHRP